MKPLITILLLGITTLSCQKVGIKDTRNDLIGTWEWVFTSGGQSGMTITPATEGYTQLLQFTKQNVTKYRDGSVQSSMPYTLDRGESIYTGQEETLIQFGSGGMTQSVVIEADTLLLREECFDCYSHKYVRIQ